MKLSIVHILVVVSANLFNLIIIGIMISRPKGWGKLEHIFGLINTALVIPLGLAVTFHWINRHEGWLTVLPGVMVLFLVVEYVLDYRLKSNFRQTRWLGPYLLMFYLAQWGLIGYAFGVSKVYGFITLLTYFLSLGATAFSYAKVRHGDTQ
jgi:hypothetical protein